MSEPYSPPELGRAVERIELDIREIKNDVKSQSTVFVTRGEFEAWRLSNDREVRDIKAALAEGLAAMRTDLGGIRQDLKNSSPQWWVIAALGCSGVGLMVSLIIAVTG
ncbi:hypothetical protein [Nocardioides stalactiti]|uniref:hypothetical protein n=1 Tax=Nocardioides stalactiti TaxID=2755356 RepID=UPI0015FEC368|nr:hypothetical protein [Nocardioides stalactiti]